MKVYGNRLTALLLALCIILGLAACGSGGDKKNGSDANQLSGTVYVPEFLDLGIEVDYIDSGCCDGENVYLVASVSTEEEVTDPDTGETYTNYDYHTALYRIPLDGSGAVELENYEPAYDLSDDSGWSNVRGIRCGADGTLWVTEAVDLYSYDLPDDFDETKDNKWEYQTETEEIQLERQLDSTGKEISRMESSALRELLDAKYVDNTVLDDKGYLYVSYTDQDYKSGVAVVKDGDVVCKLEGNAWRLFRLSDGTLATEYYTEENGDVVRCIDAENKQWGTEYPMSGSYARSIYDGAGKYLFYYDSGDSLYGYNTDTNTGERLFSWSSADINVDDLMFFTFLDDGRVAAMTRSYGSEGTKYEIAILSEADASVLANKTILTYATMSMDQQVRNNIIAFNRSSDKYRIEIRDYSEYNTTDDRSAGLTRLNTEIIGGNVPDIIGTDDIPVSRYAAKGILEDLWPMIDADPDISRASLMENVFKAAEINGKLYQVFDSFNIATAIGSVKVVGERMGWTLADLQAALATMPEGCKIFGEGDTQDNMLSVFLAMNLDSYVDWETGESHFDSDAFKAALEFCKSFPAEYDWNSTSAEDREGTPTSIMNGHQMLQEMYLSDFDDIQMYEAMFGGNEALKTYNIDYNFSSSGGSYSVVVSDSASGSSGGGRDSNVSKRLIPGRYISYVGFPREDGGVGSCFAPNRGMAISSTCKDKEGAWSFVRQLLLPAAENDEYSWRRWGFPSNKADFDKNAEEAMEVEYMTDSEGKKVLDADGNPIQESKGGWTWDTLDIDLVATTQEEYDQVMELYNAIDSVYSYDESIFEIVTDQTGAYFSGDKPLEETVTQVNDRVKLYINENR
ncbi:MAG: hypothetical protein K2O18_14165 [Oscillospiraceae bacterium]|nr:hypothetical protein [Oscillospiraceae bacterium]